MLIPEVQPNINHYPFFEHDEEFNAWDMLDSFFTIFTLTDIRKSLFDMYEAALHDDWLNGNAKERHDLLYLYVRLNDLVTSAYVVAKEKYMQQQAAEKESENSSPEIKDVANA